MPKLRLFYLEEDGKQEDCGGEWRGPCLGCSLVGFIDSSCSLLGRRQVL